MRVLLRLLRLFPVRLALCVLLAAALPACAVGSENSAGDERLRALEAKAQSLEESLAAFADENVALEGEVAALEGEVAALEGEVAALEGENAALKGEIAVLRQELEAAAAKAEWAFADKEQWPEKENERSPEEGDAVASTVRLAEEAGSAVSYVEHPGRGDRTVLVLPRQFVDGATPLIVSLHGFGGNSAYQSMYAPLHARVNARGFALLLPNGSRNREGSRFWNPTDECCDGGKSGENDVAYLTELVAEAEKLKDFGPVYLFGYSNGGFMAYHMACKGLPGLRAVASLAGTSYVEDSSCEGAPPVSVLHVHGTADDVILYEGVQSEPADGGDPAFYAGAQEMARRWSQRAGCDWPANPQPYAAFDFDQHAPGAETHTFRLESGCAPGITIELWRGTGSGHAPAYTDAFLDALVDWLLAQE